MIAKLAALKGLLQEIADDPDFAKLNTKTQDVIEDMTYDIPIEITLLKGKDDANSNAKVSPGDNLASGLQSDCGIPRSLSFP